MSQHLPPDLPGPAVDHVEDPEPDEPSAGRPGSRRTLALALLVGLVVVGLAVTLPPAVSAWRDATDRSLKEVKAYEVRAFHTSEDVDYDPAPAPGGPHDPRWLDCGVYDEPVRDEHAEHSLEHGTVWLTYDPDAVSADDIDRLAEALPDEGILSPYPDQAAPVIVTVWGRQLLLRNADDGRLGVFLVEYGDGHTAPEPMASCAGGVRILDNGDDVSGTFV